MSEAAETAPFERHPVIALDVDHLLCTIVEKMPEDPPLECPCIPYEHEGYTYYHFFLPYLDVLFRLLPAWGARVTFFSSARGERNETVLPKLLDLCLGPGPRPPGQFVIHSADKLRLSHRDDPREYGNKVKDMRRVVEPGESVDDAVLVEDQPSYAAGDQLPPLRGADLCLWTPDRSEEGNAFCKNGVAWLLGVFSALCLREPYTQMPFRAALARWHVDALGPEWDSERPAYPTQKGLAVFCEGLQILRAHIPEAVLFGSLKHYKLERLVLPPGAYHTPEQVWEILEMMRDGRRDPRSPTAAAFFDHLARRSDLADDAKLQKAARALRPKPRKPRKPKKPAKPA